MIAYKPLGYYNDFEDIIDLFPSAFIKGDEADIISKYMLDGYGAFHVIDRPDLDAYITPKEAKEDPNVFVSFDKKYAVRLSEGSMELLKEAENEENYDIDHGYFIDVYELVDDPDFEPDEGDGRLFEAFSKDQFVAYDAFAKIVKDTLAPRNPEDNEKAYEIEDRLNALLSEVFKTLELEYPEE